jgi:hypothetical protein
MFYQDLRTVGYRGVSELVDVVEEIAEEGVGKDEKSRE